VSTNGKNGQHEQSHGWCSLRLRFEERELTLLKGAEQLRGVTLAHTARPQVLRTALNLAKAGHKLGAAAPGASVVFEEAEVGLLLDAVRFATGEVRWATRAQEDQDARRREAVLTAFPELVDRGVWRSFGLSRELETVAARLQTALNA
jgi:hypothetical protein